MSLVALRPRAERSQISTALLVAAVGCALLLAVIVPGRPAGTWSVTSEPSPSETPPATAPKAAGSPYALMQMNLCLSGLGGCYRTVAYPAVVGEAVARIRDLHPDAVTFNEACRRDAARIARRTDYHLRFSRVIYLGTSLPCIRPRGRGLFGHAVLTKAPIDGSAHRAFETQAGIEQRRWLCVITRLNMDVCTAHLSTRHTTTAAATNDAQCVELTALLARRAAASAIVFGGDVNRRRSCAPEHVWARTDGSANQAPGVQHVYGSAALRPSSTEVLPSRHSDHDLLLVRAWLVPQ